ncbi:gamma-butyrobetaine hydroxylase-like domain-containing protein [Marinimicrobium sp. ARAG 43.8]|uniref:gamma-butyrobetaine hydroxylase-like domain-containing protein n=1 Tax=Marinimicrobium sp. ARAG 43.8 TaxID=3418719 RepID=UPI003CF8270A
MTPDKILLHKKSRQLELAFSDHTYRLDAEYLRVHSPSAEVRGHGASGGTLPFGKRDVAIEHIEAAGNYALKVIFDDGHDSGIYTWEYLHDLCVNEETHWQAYLEALHQSGKAREPDTQIVRLL